MRTEPRQGMALLLVAGILGVLGFLTVAFLLLSRLERQSASHRLNATRAFLLARAGLEDLMARRGGGQDPDLPAAAYAGEDLNADGLLSPSEQAEEVYRLGRLDLEACPLAHALRPAFSVRSAAVPAQISVDGRRRGWSGHLDSAPAEAHFSLRVSSGGFDVNGGDPASPPGAGYNGVLRRMLGVLAEALDRAEGGNDGVPADQADGEALLDARPAGGWPDPDAVLAYGASIGRAEAFQALQPYLCFGAWRDLKVIRPQGQPPLLPPPASWGEILLSRPMNPLTSTREPEFERLGGRVVGRAPVDLAWALRRRPALVAMFAFLEGSRLDQEESLLTNLSYGDAIGQLASDALPLDWGAPTDVCRILADALQAFPSPIRTWADWDAWCDSIGPPFSGVLQAAFNPNSRIHKFNPNQSTWRGIDKSDLAAYSTEWSLERIQPWRVESLGRVLDGRGRLLASRRLCAVLPAPRILRLTTQREFVCGDLGSPDLAGDEGPARAPGDAAFLAPATGVVPAWGHAFPGAPGGGWSVQSYPQPYAGGWTAPADYDGNLQLATLETPGDEDYGTGGVLSMLARYDDGFDLDVAAGAASFLEDVGHAAASAPLIGASRLNALRPDGIYAEKGRTPRYPSAGNLPGIRALLSFWMKRMEVRELPTYRGRPLLELTNVSVPAPFDINNCPNQFFLLAEPHKQSEAVRYCCAAFEIGHNTDDVNREHQFRLIRPADLGHRWELLTLYYDFAASSAAGTGRLIANAGLLAAERAEFDAYGAGGNSGFEAMDITAADLLGEHAVSLGSLRGSLFYSDVADQLGSGADATFDEFLVLEVPQDPAVAALLASQRWQDGRYYGGDAYVAPSAYGAPPPEQAAAWISAPIGLSGWLREVRWTLSVPPELPKDYVEVELLDAAGTDYLGPASGSRSTLAPGWSASRQSWTANRKVGGPFRLRTLFRRTASLPPGTPLLDSPVLDDLTLVFAPGDPVAWSSP